MPKVDRGRGRRYDAFVHDDRTNGPTPLRRTDAAPREPDTHSSGV
ncbi:hypothetical protein [Streptomonospora alba]|nr:hypothetical protein [Streptomonospora alba]